MGELERMQMWPAFMDVDDDTLELVIERAQVVEGVTFSAAAMEQLHDQLLVYVGTRLMRRWEATDEPPTRLFVSITVTAS